jgi:hypothetical protein
VAGGVQDIVRLKRFDETNTEVAILAGTVRMTSVLDAIK